MNRIKCLRSTRRMSQTAFAKLFHVDQTAVSNWEKGKNSIDIKILEKIAEEFVVPMEFVIGKSFSLDIPMEKWHPSQKEDYENALPEEKDYILFRHGKGKFLSINHSVADPLSLSEEENSPSVTDGEPEENVIIFHRNGKTQKKKFTKEQMAMFIALVDAIPDKEDEF